MPTEQNITDVFTKCSRRLSLENDSAWIHGSSMLYQPSEQRPTTELVEARGVVLFLAVVEAETISSWPVARSTIIFLLKPNTRQAQFESFADEISALTKNMVRKPGEQTEKIETLSSIYKRSTVLYEEGTVRASRSVGGKRGASLRRAELTSN